MPSREADIIEVDGMRVDLRDRRVAAVLAWLWPGAGHLYQRRYFKGWMLMLCILTTFFIGYSVGGGRVVYASWLQNDRRWHYLCQVCVGIPALPALVQLRQLQQHTFNGVTEDYDPRWNGFMAPPRRPLSDSSRDQLAVWHEETGAGFELGSWYTVIAGLLNLLAIFDAWGGPLDIAISGKKRSTSEPEPEPNSAPT